MLVNIQEGKVFFSGVMSKQHSSVMRLSKTWKKLFWVLDTKKLSCYQGEHV